MEFFHILYYQSVELGNVMFNVFSACQIIPEYSLFHSCSTVLLENIFR